MDQRTKSVIGLSMLGGIGAVALVPTAFLFGNPYSDTGIAVITAVAVLATLWGLFWAWRAFNRSDEYMREASKHTWYWGGTIGISLSMPVFIFVMLGGLRWFGVPPGNKHTAVAFALGYALATLSAFGGTIVAAVIWGRSKV